MEPPRQTEAARPAASLSATPQITRGRRWRRGILWTVAALAGLVSAVFLGLAVAVRVVPFDPASLESPEISSQLSDRNGVPLRAYLGTDERWRVPVRLAEVSPWVVKATLAAEDKRFFQHGGVDLLAMARAFASNLAGRRIVSGASTLTMQVAGLGGPRERTIRRKLWQVFRALQVEHTTGKERILELYLTNAPYGGNVCGIESGARRYFGKGAAELTLGEAALLAGIPQSPTRLRPDRNLTATLERRREVLRRMAAAGMITTGEAKRVQAQSAKIGLFDAPALAPHFCDLAHSMYPRVSRLRTTLDLPIQRIAERALAVQLGRLTPQGVSNCAAVVIENRTGAVLAMVGSADYRSLAIQGQVNGATSPRSPGSALKPLIYALAFDRGILAPQSLLADAPAQYAGYEPENYDRTYQGLVRADKALAWSLNVPAIHVLEQVGLSRALSLMRRSGLATLDRPPGEYGLSLAIGTCGVTLLDIANAYAMLARGGEYLPWRVTPDTAKDEPTTASRLRQAPAHLLSAGAAYLALRVLADPVLRPPEEVAPELAGVGGIAWKTGTSSGYRDAWTLACSRYYTVGVWMGNFDGRPSAALVGARASAPAALGILAQLKPAPADNWPVAPRGGVVLVPVCAETGLAPGTDCLTTRTAEQVPDAGALPPCLVHRRLMVDDATSEILCTRCLGERPHHEHVFTRWPPKVAAWLAQQGLPQDAPPRHFRGCDTMGGAAAPRITSPADGDTFLFDPSRDQESQKVALQAAVSPAARRVFWFVNGKLERDAAPGETVWLLPRAGTQVIRCADDAGRADVVRINISADAESAGGR